jgi:serine/threonine protein kinase
LLFSFYCRTILASLYREEIYFKAYSPAKGNGMDNPYDLTGKMLGTCRLERIIGRGGSSVVYLSQQVRPQRLVAVKVLLPNQPVGSPLHQQFLTRFEHEADIIARLEHENIIQIFEYNEQDGYAYLVMPYISGGNLLKVLVQQGRLSLHETTGYFTQAAGALDYAHANGVIHRDLKPGNFLLRPNGRLVLSDFGIARMMQYANQGADLTTPSLLLGTPEYMAPEMARGEPVDPYTDIYELGIVLYQLLSGELPFRGETPYTILLQHLEEPVPLLHHVYPDIPPAVDQVIQRATAKRREDRYSSVGQMAQELLSALRAPYYQVNDPPYQAASTSPLFPYRQPVIQRIPPTLEAMISSPTSRPIAAPVTPQQLFLPALTQSIDSSAPRGSADKIFASTTTRSIAAPVQPVDPRRHHRVKPFALLVILAVCLFAVAGSALLVYVQFTNLRTVPASSHAPSLGEEAQAFVQQYYADLNNRNYQAAFQMWQQKTTSTYCGFLAGYAQTEHDDIITQLGQVKGDKIDVPITLVATETLPTGRVISTYKGYEELQQIGGSLKITGGSIPPPILRVPSTMELLPVLAAGASTTQQAQAVIQQYYDYINQRDYPAAYSLWGQNYHAQTRYCDFVSGYAHTQRIDVQQMNALTPSGDGTIPVDATITAHEDIPAIDTYMETYIIGQESGAWKILSGTQN